MAIQIGKPEPVEGFVEAQASSPRLDNQTTPIQQQEEYGSLGEQFGAGVETLKGGLVGFVGATIEDRDSPEYRYSQQYAKKKAENAAKVKSHADQIHGVTDVFIDPLNTAQAIPELIARSAPQMATAMIPGVGLPTLAASQAGNIYAQQAEDEKNLAAATAGGIASAGLERLGVERIFKGAGTTGVRRVLGAGAGESATEAGQTVIENIATQQQLEGATEGAGTAAVLGGLTGASMRGGVELTKAGKDLATGNIKLRRSLNKDTQPLSDSAEMQTRDAVKTVSDLSNVSKELERTDLTAEERDQLNLKRKTLNEQIGVPATLSAAEGLRQEGVILSPEGFDFDINQGLSKASPTVLNAGELLGFTRNEMKNAARARQLSQIGVQSYAGTGEGAMQAPDAITTSNREKAKKYMASIQGKIDNKIDELDRTLANIDYQRSVAASPESKAFLNTQATQLRNGINSLRVISEQMGKERTNRSEIQDSISLRAQEADSFLSNLGLNALGEDFNPVLLAKTYLSANDIMMKQDPSFYEGITDQYRSSKLLAQGFLSASTSGITELAGLAGRVTAGLKQKKLEEKLDTFANTAQEMRDNMGTDPDGTPSKEAAAEREASLRETVSMVPDIVSSLREEQNKLLEERETAKDAEEVAKINESLALVTKSIKEQEDIIKDVSDKIENIQERVVEPTTEAVVQTVQKVAEGDMTNEELVQQTEQIVEDQAAELSPAQRNIAEEYDGMIADTRPLQEEVVVEEAPAVMEEALIEVAPEEVYAGMIPARGVAEEAPVVEEVVVEEAPIEEVIQPTTEEAYAGMVTPPSPTVDAQPRFMESVAGVQTAMDVRAVNDLKRDVKEWADKNELPDDSRVQNIIDSITAANSSDRRAAISALKDYKAEIKAKDAEVKARIDEESARLKEELEKGKKSKEQLDAEVAEKQWERIDEIVKDYDIDQKTVSDLTDKYDGRKLTNSEMSGVIAKLQKVRDDAQAKIVKEEQAEWAKLEAEKAAEVAAKEKAQREADEELRKAEEKLAKEQEKAEKEAKAEAEKEAKRKEKEEKDAEKARIAAEKLEQRREDAAKKALAKAVSDKERREAQERITQIRADAQVRMAGIRAEARAQADKSRKQLAELREENKMQRDEANRKAREERDAAKQAATKRAEEAKAAKAKAAEDMKEQAVKDKARAEEDQKREVTRQYVAQVDSLSYHGKKLGMSEEDIDDFIDTTFGPLAVPLKENALRTAWNNMKKSVKKKPTPEMETAINTLSNSARHINAEVSTLAKRIESIEKEVSSKKEEIDVKALADTISADTASHVLNEVRDMIATANKETLTHIENLATELKKQNKAPKESEELITATKTVKGIHDKIDNRKKKGLGKKVNGVNGLLFRSDIIKLQQIMGQAHTAYMGPLGANLTAKAFGMYNPKGSKMYYDQDAYETAVAEQISSSSPIARVSKPTTVTPKAPEPEVAPELEAPVVKPEVKKEQPKPKAKPEAKKLEKAPEEPKKADKSAVDATKAALASAFAEVEKESKAPTKKATPEKKPAAKKVAPKKPTKSVKQIAEEDMRASVVEEEDAKPVPVLSKQYEMDIADSFDSKGKVKPAKLQKFLEKIGKLLVPLQKDPRKKYTTPELIQLGASEQGLNIKGDQLGGLTKDGLTGMAVEFMTKKKEVGIKKEAAEKEERKQKNIAKLKEAGIEVTESPVAKATKKESAKKEEVEDTLAKSESQKDIDQGFTTDTEEMSAIEKAIKEADDNKKVARTVNYTEETPDEAFDADKEYAVVDDTGRVIKFFKGEKGADAYAKKVGGAVLLTAALLGSGGAIAGEEDKSVYHGKYDKVATVLGKRESSNNYKAVNRLGYAGKYQFGAAALTDLGYMNKKPAKMSQKEWMKQGMKAWTGKGGISSLEEYLNEPDVQEEIASQWFGDIERRIKRMGLVKYIGKEVDGVKITMDGLIAASHLKGPGAVKYGLRKGDLSAADANGTTIAEYMNLVN